MAKSSGSTKKSTSSSPKGLSRGSSQSVSMADVIKAKFEYSGGGYYDLRGKGFKGRVVATTGYDYGLTVYEASATVKGETVSLGDFKTLSKATKAVKDYIKQNLKLLQIQFVEGRGLTASMGQKVYTNDPVRKKIEGMMPLYIEKANNWKKKNS